MIPYDDLVAALSAWRARQGLPVSTMGGTGSGATPSPGSGPHAQVGSGPHAAPGSGPNRAGPPSPPPSGRMQAQPEVEEVVDDAAMLDEEAYENEGNDFAMAFGADVEASEATSIGEAPERPTEADLSGTRDREDW